MIQTTDETVYAGKILNRSDVGNLSCCKEKVKNRLERDSKPMTLRSLSTSIYMYSA